MNIKRILVTSFFSLTLAVSALGYAGPVRAENDVDSAPVLHEAEAKNSGGTSAKEAGDSVVLEFSETTNKFAITASNIVTVFSLNNGHSFLDGAGAISSASWSDDGEELTIVLSAGTSLPTVATGDTVTVSGTSIKDLGNNAVTGNAIIDGSFISSDDDNDETECKASVSVTATNPNVNDDDSDTNEDADDDTDEVDEADEDEDDDIAEDDSEDQKDEDEDCDEDSGDDSGKYHCGTGLQNGTLYRVEGSQTVYLMASCQLKPFRGIAAFNSRGHKFSDIRTLTTLPVNVSISDKPALPAEGTLIKGSDKTVWFVSKSGKREGFTSAEVFLALGFKFDQVDEITDSDLGTVALDKALINDSTRHPDGALIKCGNSASVFIVIDNLRFPFANAEAFQERGHRFDHILPVDCGKFAYAEGPAVTK